MFDQTESSDVSFPGSYSAEARGAFRSDEVRATIRDRERLFPEVFVRKLEPSPVTGSTPGRVERKKWVTRRAN